jgi:cathepsin A (carboxypeptidase C)|eukprot:4502545-Prymnesium_polylepis.1
MLSIAAAAATAAPERFEVKSLPGWDGPLVSKTYCGFSSAGVPPSGVGTMYFNYIFLESENDPKNDPVIVWYNGGPGVSRRTAHRRWQHHSARTPSMAAAPAHRR